MSDDVRAELRKMGSLRGAAPGFVPGSAPAEPAALFLDWLRLARDSGVTEPHAMTVSTVGEDGVPDARVLILKDVTPDGSWLFASSAFSAKGAQLQATPAAALTFFWPQLARSVRVRGPVERAGADESAADFLARRPDARALALSGTQSAPLAGDAELGAEIAAAAERIDADPGLVAEGWTVWRVRASAVEFWEGSADRRHIRLRYARGADGSFTRERLRP